MSTPTPRPDAVDIGAELDALNAAIDQLRTAREAIDDAVEALSRKAVDRLPSDLAVDWSTPDHMWLNAFSCIRPTDAFAAAVGRSIIRQAMQAHPERVVLSVNAS